jgi:hypothetical protein
VRGEKGVVVPYYNAGFGTEFVDCGTQMGEEGEFRSEVHYVEDIRVVV